MSSSADFGIVRSAMMEAVVKKIYIFGVGKGKDIVRSCIREQETKVLGYIDNAAASCREGVDGLPVFSLEEISDDYDFILISVMQYQDILRQLEDNGVDASRIIRFFDMEDALNPVLWTVLDKNSWQLEVLLYTYRNTTFYRQQNIKYEIADSVRKGEFVFPTILPAAEAVDRICRERASLVRFGDGEFSLMKMRKRAKYQETDEKLAARLQEVLHAKEDKLLVAVADIYGSLERFTQPAAEAVRIYLTPDVRSEHMKLLETERTYYDALLSRPYVMFKDKENAGERFEKLKRIWEGRDVVVIEGMKTRMGVGNDLFDHALSVRRITAPSENAFGKYEDILAAALAVEKDKLILISLGPTAKVLAYDLHLKGYQAVDIGHLDIEYEWFLRGVRERCDIPCKYVQEVRNGEIVSDEMDAAESELYHSQIMAAIEG